MDLSKISNSELLNRLEKLTRTERKITHLILWHINETEARRLYAELGFSSMFEYMTQGLAYGESSAYRRLQAARLVRQIPEISEKLEEGSLNLSQLTHVQKCLKQEKKEGHAVSLEKTKDLLAQVENKSSYETQKILALELNQPIQVHEVIKAQQDQSTRLELTFTGEQMKVLRQVKDLLSHSLPDATWSEVFTHLAKLHIKKILGKEKTTEAIDLIQKQKHEEEQEEGKKAGIAQNKTQVARKAISTQRLFTKPRKHIAITLKRSLLKDAGHCCEYIDRKSGRRCRSTFQLEVEHKIPLAKRGSNERFNLRIFCRTHNALAARQWGLAKE